MRPKELSVRLPPRRRRAGADIRPYIRRPRSSFGSSSLMRAGKFWPPLRTPGCMTTRSSRPRTPAGDPNRHDPKSRPGAPSSRTRICPIVARPCLPLAPDVSGCDGSVGLDILGTACTNDEPVGHPQYDEDSGTREISGAGRRRATARFGRACAGSPGCLQGRDELGRRPASRGLPVTMPV